MNEFERLTALLVAEERLALAKLDQKLDASMEALPELLPGIIRAAHSDARLALALEKPMTDSLERVAQQRKEVLVSVLFPLIGPLIRRSISETISLLMRDLNRALDHSFSPTGLSWRIEALRSGVPFSQVVLKHTLRYRVEHLMLVQNEGGLLIARASNKDAQMADSDAVAAMLSALQDFARDAVNARQDDALASVNFGELTLSIVRGPLAHLAIAVRGELSTESMESLSSLVEEAHGELDENLFDDPVRFEPFQNVQNEELTDWLLKRGQQSSKIEDQARQEKPWIAISLTIAAFAGLFGWLSYQFWGSQRAQQLQTGLNDVPGYFAQVKFQQGFYVVSGVRDPESKPLIDAASAFGFTSQSLRSELKPYLALDTSLWIPRLQRMAALPKSVVISRTQAGLALSGTVNLPERKALRAALAGLPYLSVDLSELVLQDATAAKALRELHRSLQRLHVVFENDSPSAESARVIEEMIEFLRQMMALTEGDVALVLVDRISTTPANEGISRRSQWVAAQLKAQLPGLNIQLAQTRVVGEQEMSYVAISKLRY